MRRRGALLAMLSLGVAGPLCSHAQQPGRTYRVGLFLGGTETAVARQRAAIVERLAMLGFVEGRNLLIEVRVGSFDRLIDANVARALVAWRPEAILVDTSPLAVRTREATSAIPIVVTGVADPIGSGLVKGFARPGGNVTGIHVSHLEIAAKRLELLRELLPDARRVMMALDIGGPELDTLPHLRQVASRLGFELIEIQVSSWGFFGGATREKADAVISGQPWVIYGMEHVADQIIWFASERRVPSVFWESELAERGATLAYGVNLTKELGRATDQLARVLKGAKPAELPMDSATSYELVVNRKAARALQITVPLSILVRADRVID